MPIRDPITPADLLQFVDSLSRKVEALPEPGPGMPGHDLVLVTKSMMRGVLMQSGAFAAASAAGSQWPAGSNLRSIFELHLDIRYMLTNPSPERLARRVVLYAMQDMSESEPGGNSALLAAIDGFRPRP